MYHSQNKTPITFLNSHNFKDFLILRYVYLWIVIDVSEECSASRFRTEKCVFHLEDYARKLFRNVDNDHHSKGLQREIE